MSALVSVIIPVYNAEKYIANCLKSVMNQTYENIEIICVDDGSKDRSGSIIKSLAENCSKIKYVYQQNAGVSAARNNGLSAAEGDFIVFLDSDDYIHPQTIELFLDCEEKAGADIVCCKYKSTQKTDERTDFIEKYDFTYPDYEYLFNSSDRIGRCVWGKLIKSDVAKKCEFPLNLKLGEDLYYMVKVLESNLKISLINEELWFYYSNPDSLTHIVSIESEIQMLRHFDSLCADIQNSDCGFLKGFVLETIYKSFFRIRSRLTGVKSQKSSLKECKKCGRKWLLSFLKCSNIKSKTKIIYTVFYFSRLIYEKIFIMHDPTMKDYYNNLRKK